MKVIGVIPCKLDSKRLALKNLQTLNGKSLLGISCEYLASSKYIDTIYISTDRPDLVEGYKHNDHIAQSNIKIIKRPPHLCRDTYLLEVYNHVGKELNYAFDYMAITTPDSIPKPFSIDRHIKECIDKKLHELFTVDNETGMKTSALNILSKEAVIKGMVAGYTKTLQHGSYDIHDKGDLEYCNREMKIYTLLQK